MGKVVWSNCFGLIKELIFFKGYWRGYEKISLWN